MYQEYSRDQFQRNQQVTGRVPEMQQVQTHFPQHQGTTHFEGQQFQTGPMSSGFQGQLPAWARARSSAQFGETGQYNQQQVGSYGQQQFGGTHSQHQQEINQQVTARARQRASQYQPYPQDASWSQQTQFQPVQQFQTGPSQQSFRGFGRHTGHYEPQVQLPGWARTGFGTTSQTGSQYGQQQFSQFGQESQYGDIHSPRQQRINQRVTARARRAYGQYEAQPQDARGQSARAYSNFGSYQTR